MAELTRRGAQCVTRFEGMVDKFTGDGITALFRAPTALEDHARRACYAGLEMQRAVAACAAELKDAEGIELALRVGIDSGDVARGRGLTRFVGRDAELRELHDALARAQGGDGQVVRITADPGLGKSRLVSEFVQDIRTQGIEVHEAHCQPHARALPLMPVLEMMRS